MYVALGRNVGTVSEASHKNAREIARPSLVHERINLAGGFET